MENRANDLEVKYRIFVSSTFKGLEENRKIVMKAILRSGHMPVAIDTFSAKEEKDREVIEKSISDCDFCILIIGSRYGEIIDIDNNNTRSYTEYEYDLAIKHMKPILSFIQDEEEINASRGKYKICDQESAKTRDYLEFICKVRKNSTPCYWSEKDMVEFAIRVTDAIKEKAVDLQKRDSTAGWMRAKDFMNRELVGLAMKNEFYLDTVKNLNSFKKLDERCLVKAADKIVAADMFNRLFMEKITKGKISLFLESGSSIAYVSKAIGKGLRSKISIDDDGSPSIHVTTNNILAYLELWLNNRIPCNFFPWGCPEEPYGASYGPISRFGIEESIADEPEPKYDLSPLDIRATTAIDILLKLPFGLTTEKKPLLMLGAISGIQLNDKHNLVYEKGHSPNDTVEANIKRHFGFHVGSYRNKVFKRYMYSNQDPIVIFIDHDKINCPIKVGKCHFVFDNKDQWEEFLENYPVSFVVGCKKGELNETKDLFMNVLGFDVEVLSYTKEITAVFAKNTKFPF